MVLDADIELFDTLDQSCGEFVEHRVADGASYGHQKGERGVLEEGRRTRSEVAGAGRECRADGQHLPALRGRSGVRNGGGRRRAEVIVVRSTMTSWSIRAYREAEQSSRP